MKKIYNVRFDGRGLYEEEIIENILKNRGIKDIDHFLNPAENDLLPFESLQYIDQAREIIEKGIENNKTIGVFFDTDCDGMCAGTGMARYLAHYTSNVNTFINFGKAHGLIGQDIEQFNGCDILIIVDSLDKDVSQYKKLHGKGIQVIVLDHHAIDSNVDYDTYITLVSSQREYENPELSGAGVVWKFCKYLDEYFMEDYADEYVDLAACGILADVCDVSESNYENRYIVYQGLCNLKNPAIKKIVGSYEFNSKSVSFSVAPLINACCRIGKNDVAMKMFLSDDNKEILKCKRELEECKVIQNEELSRLLPLVHEQFEQQTDKKVLYTLIETPYGISGLIGNKCLEIFNKPMFILKHKKGQYSGSMRSVGYGNFMELCNNTGLAKANGHDQASGIEIEESVFDQFLNVVDEELSKIEQTSETEIQVDCLINAEDITRTLIDKVKPINFVSGSGFKPLNFKVTNIDEYGIGSFKQGKHLVITPTDHLQLIEWNTNADYDFLEECALMNEPIEVIGELDSGWFIKKFMLKVICNEVKVVS